jgi:hypothetical protein
MKQPGEKSLPILFRGSLLEADQIKRIRLLIERGQWRTRQEIIREICRIFGWRRPNGTLAIRSAHSLLVRLDRMGLICLAAPRRVQGRPHHQELKAAAAMITWPEDGHEQASLLAVPLRSKLVVRPIQRDEVSLWRAHMERFHYLGDAAPVGESLRYVAEVDGKMMALLSYGGSVAVERAARHLSWLGRRHQKGLGSTRSSTTRGF